MKKSIFLSKNVLSRVGIFFSFLTIAAVAVYIYSPVVGINAATDATPDVSLRVRDVLALRVDKNSINLIANPNRFTTDTVVATVTTNSHYGYTLTIEDTDDSANMVHSDVSIEDVLTSTFEGPKTSSAMSENTWGYSTDASNYYNVPVNGSPAVLRRVNFAPAALDDNTTITFGAKLGYLTSGSYSDRILYTIYSNGQPDNPEEDPYACDDHTLMQCFVCSEDLPGGVGASTVLTDARDGNEYAVARLEDGQCWMTENLRLGKDSSMLLTPTTTNIRENYVLPASDITSFTSQNKGGAVYVDSTYGGYYNHYTATAGRPDYVGSNGYYFSSICPKNWVLPEGGADSMYLLLYNQYNNNYSLMIDGQPNFQLGGYIINGEYTGRDAAGYYWNNAVSTDEKAYYATFYNGVTWNDRYRYYGQSVRCIYSTND